MSEISGLEQATQGTNKCFSLTHSNSVNSQPPSSVTQDRKPIGVSCSQSQPIIVAQKDKNLPVSAQKQTQYPQLTTTLIDFPELPLNRSLILTETREEDKQYPHSPTQV